MSFQSHPATLRAGCGGIQSRNLRSDATAVDSTVATIAHLSTYAWTGLEVARPETNWSGDQIRSAACSVKSGTGLGEPRSGSTSWEVLMEETGATAVSIRSAASTSGFADAGSAVAGVVVGSDAPSDISQHDEASTRTSSGFGQPVSEQLQEAGPDCRHAAIVAPGANARNKTANSKILVERAFKRVASVRSKHTVDLWFPSLFHRCSLLFYSLHGPGISRGCRRRVAVFAYADNGTRMARTHPSGRNGLCFSYPCGTVICANASLSADRSLSTTSPTRQSMSAPRCSGKRCRKARKLNSSS